MRKGEKLYKHIQSEWFNSQGIPNINIYYEYIVDRLRNLTNEEFDKIIGKGKCKKCEQEKELEVCDDCYDDTKSAMYEYMELSEN